MMVFCSQAKYVTELSHKTGMFSCKAVSKPLSISKKKLAYTGVLEPNDSSHYYNIVSGLQYLILMCPDLSFTINKICQYLHSLTTVHLIVVKRILQYIKGTIDLDFRLHDHRRH
jgi:hypothetical protein